MYSICLGQRDIIFWSHHTVCNCFKRVNAILVYRQCVCLSEVNSVYWEKITAVIVQTLPSAPPFKCTLNLEAFTVALYVFYAFIFFTDRVLYHVFAQPNDASQKSKKKKIWSKHGLSKIHKLLENACLTHSTGGRFRAWEKKGGEGENFQLLSNRVARAVWTMLVVELKKSLNSNPALEMVHWANN